MNNLQMHVKPTHDQLLTQKEYWTIVCPNDKELPAWAFDFIGVHLDKRTGVWSLSSPSCLLDGGQPAWTNLSFSRRDYALSFARSLARQHGIFSVDCSVTLGM